jgi:hypothetical protein
MMKIYVFLNVYINNGQAKDAGSPIRVKKIEFRLLPKAGNRIDR